MKIKIKQDNVCKRNFYIIIPNIENLDQYVNLSKSFHEKESLWDCDDITIRFRPNRIDMRFSYFGKNEDIKPRKLTKELKELFKKYQEEPKL